MFGISFSEFILIGVVAVIVFGPEQLPIIARKSGEIFANIRNTRRKVSEQFYSQLGIDELNQLKEELTQTVEEIRQTVNLSNHYEYSEQLSEHFNYEIYYQPELDFNSQPELFDE